MCCSSEITAQMRKFYQSLSEKYRRRYAAIEVAKIGYSGISYISRILATDRNTISKGIKQLKSESQTTFERHRIRQKGGGRKTSESLIPGLNETFLEVLKDYTAGSPMDEKIKWTNLTQEEIAEGLKVHGITVSVTVVKKLLKKHGYVKRQAQKKQTTGIAKNRNEQFENLARITEVYELQENHIISMDTKKRNLLEIYIAQELCILPKQLPHLTRIFSV